MGAGALTARADWPAKVFAPYMYVGFGDDFKLTDGAEAGGVNHYTLAFVIALQTGDHKKPVYQPVPSWDGRIPMDQRFYADQIEALRRRGGDVIASFGGESGKELANVIDDPAQLQRAYQTVIDRYRFTWLDFDIEGRSLNRGKAANERRNTALATLQKANPGLIVSYTLPVDPAGLSAASLALLADAMKQGVRIRSVNLMVMYFGKNYTHHGKSEGQLGIDSANQAHGQLAQIDPAIQIGLCPRIGKNGSADELFTLEDAKTLKAFADQTPWICSLHYWNINEDANLPKYSKDWAAMGKDTPAAEPLRPWSFAKIFQPFTQ